MNNFICCFCNKQLATSEMGVRSHLRMHINSGEMKQKDLTSISLKIMKREYVHHDKKA